ncbi:class I SAM-dependent methyltransferase [Patescibacteria group bacterium]|nr:class I SAM-dependent methyltransferase [Patescibacteria group bacterium]MBU4580353.1 class I SAM-dependent methyltransferase [Patescibacteria group bacterium]
MPVDYKKIYDRDYFNGKNSFFWKLGYGNFSKIYFDNTFKPIAKYDHAIKNLNILDAGCAYGLMLERFSSSFHKFGIDVSQYAIDIAQKRLPEANFKTGNIEERLPYEENFFDIVLANDLLEHLENPMMALKNIYRVLKKGGILYITTPNLNNTRKIILKYADEKEHHVSLFLHLDLMDNLRKIGFKVEEHWTFVNLFVYLRFKSNMGTESGFICRK